jgi:hypothetical protein
MTQEFYPSTEFADFFFLAIDHGFGSIEHGGGPLVPFVMSISLEGEKTLSRFVADMSGEAVILARDFIPKKQADLRMYALAYDGYLSREGVRTDGIFVEAGDREQPKAVLFCQRYRQVTKGLFGKIITCERIGNPALIGYPPSYFASSQ